MLSVINSKKLSISILNFLLNSRNHKFKTRLWEHNENPITAAILAILLKHCSKSSPFSLHQNINFHLQFSRVFNRLFPMNFHHRKSSCCRQKFQPLSDQEENKCEKLNKTNYRTCFEQHYFLIQFSTNQLLLRGGKKFSRDLPFHLCLFFIFPQLEFNFHNQFLRKTLARGKQQNFSF